MTPHCKGCRHHHSANHPKTAKKELQKFNDWCCKFGKSSSKIVGHCRNVNGREE